MSEQPLQLRDDPEAARITGVVQRAADAAYRARIAEASRRRFVNSDELVGAREGQGISEDRWNALSESSRNAACSAEFRSFAQALSVSPRWLATGSGWIYEPPAGWSSFGTHVKIGVRMEYSVEVDECLMPLWERPLEAGRA